MNEVPAPEAACYLAFYNSTKAYYNKEIASL